MKNDKFEKENRLLNTAFKLFTEKGIKETSIQDIVDSADVAKGTFYLYFKDKYELHDILIMKKSKKLFNDALNSLNKNKVTDFVDQIIYIVDYVIDGSCSKVNSAFLFGRNINCCGLAYGRMAPFLCFI